MARLTCSSMCMLDGGTSRTEDSHKPPTRWPLQKTRELPGKHTVPHLVRQLALARAQELVQRGEDVLHNGPVPVPVILGHLHLFPAQHSDR